MPIYACVYLVLLALPSTFFCLLLPRPPYPAAMMITMFDAEILADEKALRMDPEFYGLGGQQPMGKVPFRIRKRIVI